MAATDLIYAFSVGQALPVPFEPEDIAEVRPARSNMRTLLGLW